MVDFLTLILIRTDRNVKCTVLLMSTVSWYSDWQITTLTNTQCTSLTVHQNNEGVQTFKMGSSNLGLQEQPMWSIRYLHENDMCCFVWFIALTPYFKLESFFLRWLWLWLQASTSMPSKRTQQNLIVRIGKSQAEITNDKRLRSTYGTVDANQREARSITRPLGDSSYCCHRLQCCYGITHKGRPHKSGKFYPSLPLVHFYPHWRNPPSPLCGYVLYGWPLAVFHV